MKFIFAVLLLATSALAQKAEVEIDVHQSGIATMRVWHPSFEKMCQKLAIIAQVPKSTKSIKLGAKRMPPSRERYLGEEWVIYDGDKQTIVKSTDLSPVLSGIKGAVARDFAIASCYLEDGLFYSTEHMSFVSVTLEEAQAVAAVIK